MVPGGSRRKSTQKNMYELKEYVPAKNVGGVAIGPMWSNFSATLLYHSVVIIVLGKTCFIIVL